MLETITVMLRFRRSGETYVENIADNTQGNCFGYYITMANFYKLFYWNIYAGVLGWKNPWKNDGNGSFNEVSAGTYDFYANYPALVYP